MDPIVYGIPNCDTVKKARTWLTDQGLNAAFHDFKKQGVPEAQLDTWLAELGWETLLNRKGTTWRGLDAATQALAKDAASAQQLMLQWPSLVKRPVVVKGQQVVVGVNPEAWLGVIAG